VENSLKIVDTSTRISYIVRQRGNVMRIIGINGSPGKGWNTHTLAEGAALARK
jgi:hypothetical protein